MKRLIIPLCLLLVLLLGGCGQEIPEPAGPTIEPAQFSKETQEMLDVIGDIYFFDYTVDESIKAMSMDVWTYEDGEWVSHGLIYGEREPSEYGVGIGIDVETGALDIYSSENDGYVKFASYPSAFEINLDNTPGWGWGSGTLSIPTAIEPGKEIVLWQRFGYEDGIFETSDLDDFRAADVDAGVAITITFYDEPLE